MILFWFLYQKEFGLKGEELKWLISGDGSTEGPSIINKMIMIKLCGVQG